MMESILFPVPVPTYTKDCYPGELKFIPYMDCQVASSHHEDKNDDPDQRYLHQLPILLDEHSWNHRIPALWIIPDQPETILLYFHANKADLGTVYRTVKLLHQSLEPQKVGVIAMEYPGYGIYGYHPTPSPDLVRQAAESIFSYLTLVVQWPAERIIVMGRSLGTGPACYLASKYDVGGMILISAFASIARVVEELVGFNASILMNDCFVNIHLIQTVACDCLFIHGQNDELISCDQSLDLFETCRESRSKMLKISSSMTHNDFNLWRDWSKSIQVLVQTVSERYTEIEYTQYCFNAKHLEYDTCLNPEALEPVSPAKSFLNRLFL